VPRLTEVLAAFAAVVVLLDVGFVVRFLVPENSTLAVAWLGACLACNLWILWLNIRLARGG
jgi:hypothetical protein